MRGRDREKVERWNFYDLNPTPHSFEQFVQGHHCILCGAYSLCQTLERMIMFPQLKDCM